MQDWLAVELDVDEDALAERWDGQIVIDETLRAMARANRLSLWRSDPERVDLGNGTAAVELSLRCVAHADPGCRFRWVRLNVDFSGTPAAQIADLSPRDEIATHPVKLTTKRTAALSFEIASVQLGPEVGSERSSEQDVYFPKLTTSGLRLRYALWDFTAVGEAPLHVDRDLRVLLSVPSEVVAMPVTVTLRAMVTANGLAGAIPLLGRRSGEFAMQQLL